MLPWLRVWGLSQQTVNWPSPGCGRTSSGMRHLTKDVSDTVIPKIGLDNLVDLLIRCIDHPAAARLVPVLVPLLRLAGRALGKRAEIDRLVGSLQIDISHTRKALGWTPPVSVEEGIRRMVQGSSGAG